MKARIGFQRVVIVASAAALILAAFGLDWVPEVGGLGAPAFAASSPAMGCLAPYGRRQFRSGQRQCRNEKRTHGFRGVGASAREPLR